MSHRRRFAWLLLATFAVHPLGGCSSSSDETSGENAAGNASSGAAGSGSQGGSGGAAGSGATGGAAGAAGTSGGGTAGDGGTAGSGGSSGTGGTSGSAGESGSAGSGNAGESGSAGAAGTAGAAGSGQGGGGQGGSFEVSIVELSVEPANATITVVNGVPTPYPFKAMGLFSDGSLKEVEATWSFNKIDLGLITPGSGILTPHGNKGGQGKISITGEGLSANTTVTIALQYVSNPGGLSPEEQQALETPGDVADGALLYPYDKTVFARGLLAPELMWSGGAAGDKYLVHLREKFFEAKIYATAEPPSAVQLPQALWDHLTVTNGGDDVLVDVVKLSNGVVSAPMHETWKIAQGSLRGSIYYWSVKTGQLMKIAPGANVPNVVFDSGPYTELGTPAAANYNGAYPPWEPGGDGKRCVACHTVSKDGSAIAAVFEKKGSTASPWATIDLLKSEPEVVQMSSYTSQAIYLALSPDAKYAVHNDVDMTMHLANAKTGQDIASALDGFADKTADPVFSPDGKMLAFSSNATGSYPVEFWRADLDVVDFDDPSGTFSNRRQIAAGGAEAIAFPSFSPDSKYIVYQKGNYSRANYGNNQWGANDLFLSDLNGQLGAIPLAAANGEGILDEKNKHRNYQPTVNPIAVGGYFWVVFFSPRDYGNRMASSSNPSLENRKQLWVAAIDANPEPGKDPSHPAFWLGGQDLSTINMSGYWSLEACKQSGAGCNEGFECCTGFCRDDGTGATVCVEPPTNECSKIGEKCGNSNDCCDGLINTCIGGFCAAAKP